MKLLNFKLLAVAGLLTVAGLGTTLIVKAQDSATNNGYNQEIKFCCPMCQPKFVKDPDKYLKIILAAEAKQKN